MVRGRDGGLLGGPSAVDMRRRYAALGATPPSAYPADHVALLLEYASVLLEHGEREAYAAFVADHLDWLPAFRAQVDRAAADAAFYRWAVALVDDVVAAVRDRLDIPHPDAATTETMVDRLSGGRDR
ncbi:molecular chaperone TorD family protein [Halobacteriaceae archaeon GCM10025711]